MLLLRRRWSIWHPVTAVSVSARTSLVASSGTGGPASLNERIAQGDRYARLARARGLHDQGLTLLLGEFFYYPPYPSNWYMRVMILLLLSGPTWATGLRSFRWKCKC